MAKKVTMPFYKDVGYKIMGARVCVCICFYGYIYLFICSLLRGLKRKQPSETQMNFTSRWSRVELLMEFIKYSNISPFFLFS